VAPIDAHGVDVLWAAGAYNVVPALNCWRELDFADLNVFRVAVHFGPQCMGCQRSGPKRSSDRVSGRSRSCWQKRCMHQLQSKEQADGWWMNCLCRFQKLKEKEQFPSLQSRVMTQIWLPMVTPASEAVLPDWRCVPASQAKPMEPTDNQGSRDDGRTFASARLGEIIDFQCSCNAKFY